MDKRKILKTSVVLVLAPTLACGPVPQATATPGSYSPLPSTQAVDLVPSETSTPEITATQEDPIAQIGFFNSIYLRYDPGKWEAFDDFQGQQNSQGESIESLRHRDIPGCFLHDNLGRGAPPSWELQASNRVIGSLEYRAELWVDTTTEKPVLVVYQYPAGDSAYGTRIELVVDQEPERCISSAEDVLILSADLISEVSSSATGTPREP